MSTENLKYSLIPDDTMTQVNVRFSEDLLGAAATYAKKKGFGNIQELIRETLREKLFEDKLSKKELQLVKQLLLISKKKNLFGTEKELFRKLK